MLTPAQKHFQETMARHRGASQGDTMTARTAYEQMLHRLRIDKARLSGIQSFATRAEIKQTLLPDYQGWIDGALSADTGQADEVIATVMLWNIDAGNVAEGLRIGEYVLRHKLPMPDNYSRTPATVLIDEICKPVLAAFKAGASVAPVSDDLLLQLYALTSQEDMPDQVKAQLCKAMGYTIRLVPERLQEARDWLQQALEKFEGVGVKRDIEIIDRVLKKQAIEKAQAADEAGDGDIPASVVTGVSEVNPDAAGDDLPAEPAANAVAAVAVPVVTTSAAVPVTTAKKRGRPAAVKPKAGAPRKTRAAAKAAG